MKTDPTLAKVVGLLQHTHPEVQCAAAKVLGELRPRDSVVLTALGDALTSPNVLLRSYAIEALGRIGSSATLPVLVQHLTAAGDEHSRAVEALLAAGDPAVAVLQGQWEKAGTPLRFAIIDTLTRFGSEAAAAALLDLLATCDLDTAKHLCSCFGNTVQQLDTARRKAWLVFISRFLANPRIARREVSAVAALRLVRSLELPESAKLLTGFVDIKLSPIVRRHALIALRHIQVPSATAPELARRLLQVLPDRRDPDQLQTALDILRHLPVPADLATELQKLLGDPNTAVRNVALLKLAELPSEDATLSLLNAVGSVDPNLRHRAVETLAKNPAARPAIFKEFLTAADPAKIEALGEVLRRFDEPFPAGDLKKLEAKTKKAIDKGDPAGAPLLGLLVRSDPAAGARCVKTKIQALKRAKKYPEAEQLLSAAVRSGGALPGLQLELALLRLRSSPKDLAKPQRDASPAIQAVADLLRSGHPVLKAIKAEKTLDKTDLYYLGFHFSEKLGNEREFGGELLRQLIKNWPRSAEAKSAKNKMRLEGMG